LARPRVLRAAGRRAALSVLLAAASGLALAGWAGQQLRARPAGGEAPSAFVSGGTQRTLLSRRMPGDTSTAMNGGARRQNRYNKPKKTHIRWADQVIQKRMFDIGWDDMKMTFVREPTLEYWSQTLKLNFPEGEDDVVTEDEVREYFTTDEYAPDAVIVGHKLPHDPLAHAYVHFSTNEAAKKARKEKDGGSIGKASEVKAVYTDEKKWVRLRDGVSLTGGARARWMKPYGQEAYPGWSDDWAEETGTRSHPVYPVD